MCAIIGFHCKNPTEENFLLIKKLWLNSKIRGLHAFGYSFINNSELVTRKFNKLDSLIESLYSDWPITNMIGHCRYSTSGDWHNELNNQPIYKQETAMVFNGVISMKTKKEYEIEYQSKYQTENDGEIVLDKYISGENLEEFLSLSKFSFAGLLLQKNKLVAIRNQRRPLWISEFNGMSLFASTKDIFKRSGVILANELKPNSCLEISISDD